MTPVELVTTIKELAVGISAIWAAATAAQGLSTWSKEMRGKVDFEVSRALMKSAYQLRDRVEDIRQPMLSSHEFPAGYFAAKQTGDVQKIADGHAHLYRERFKPMWPVLDQFDSSVLEAEAIWGSEVKRAAADFRQELRVLQVATDAIVYNELRAGEDFRLDRAYGLLMTSRAHGRLDDANNPFSVRIKECIGKLEETVQSKLRLRTERSKRMRNDSETES